MANIMTEGMEPPVLNNGSHVTGENKGNFRRENKRRRKLNQIGQLTEPDWWTTYNGLFSLPASIHRPANYRNNMCPANLALLHPAANELLKYAMKGCPTEMGQPWTRQLMQTAIHKGPHISALVPAAVEQ